jgi:CarD family transcriptional regulator
VAFEIGDKVIYPNHGLGVIERVETKTIMGTTCGFYQLRMANETTVFVPVDNVDGVGLRRAVSDLEVQQLFTLLGDGKIDSHQNWKGRFKDNSDRMRTGSIYDVVEVLKSLTFLAKSKSLSFREKRMLDRAKFLVVSEITEVLALKTPDVERRVEGALEQCFVAKAKYTARAKASGTPAPAPARPKPVLPVPVVVAAVAVAERPKPAERPKAVAKAVERPKPLERAKTLARPKAGVSLSPAMRARVKSAAKAAPAARSKAASASRPGARRAARAS